MKRLMIALFLGLILLYLIACILLYFFQEKLLFHPHQLKSDYEFRLEGEFEELTLKSKDGVLLHALHFLVQNSKGVVLFFHGNGGTVNEWGASADPYIQKGFEVVYVDYRGYGKSEGKIESEQQLIEDAQLFYDYLKNLRPDRSIILSGTSMGTGIATAIAARNDAHALILNAPYYGLLDLILEKVPILPPKIIRYRLQTASFLSKVECPTTIFHGSDDRLIPLTHAQCLKNDFPRIDLHVLQGAGHNFLGMSKDYRERLDTVLSRYSSSK